MSAICIIYIVLPPWRLLRGPAKDNGYFWTASSSCKQTFVSPDPRPQCVPSSWYCISCSGTRPAVLSSSCPCLCPAGRSTLVWCSQGRASSFLVLKQHNAKRTATLLALAHHTQPQSQIRLRSLFADHQHLHPHLRQPINSSNPQPPFPSFFPPPPRLSTTACFVLSSPSSSSSSSSGPSASVLMTVCTFTCRNRNVFSPFDSSQKA